MGKNTNKNPPKNKKNKTDKQIEKKQKTKPRNTQKKNNQKFFFNTDQFMISYE